MPPLPPNPSLRFLRKQAKALLKAQRAGDPSSCATLRLLHEFSGVADEGILATDLTLSKVQFALALDYGFKDWKDMRAHVDASFHESLRATVRREGDRAWMAGVPNLAGWGKDEENTFMGSLALTLRVLGEDMSYTRLMGVSGMAFRLQIHRPDLCASAPDAACGFNCIAAAMQALGRSYQEVRPHGNAQQGRAEIIDSIDRGVPVLAINLEPGMDWGVITGYSDGGEKLLCRLYDLPSHLTEEYSEAPLWPDMIVALAGKSSSAAGSPDVEALKTAVMLAHAERFGKYASGFAALEAWIEDMLDDAKHEPRQKEKPHAGLHDNAWCFWSFNDARIAASRYLQAIAEDFTPPVAASLQAAAELYGRISARLEQGGSEYAPFESQIGDRPWSTDMRHKQAGVLAEVLAWEREAVAEIEQAMSGLEGR